MKNIGSNKLILLILFFPLASFSSEDYNEGATKIIEILYNGSQEKKDLDAGFKYAQQRAPKYVVKALEIILPTANALREQRLELRYVKSF